MVYEPRRIGVSFRERLQHAAVHRAGTFRLNRAVDGQARKFVAKTERVSLHVKQTPGAGFVDRGLPRAKNRLDEPGLGPAGGYSDDLGQLARGGRAARQPRYHSIAYGLRDEFVRAREHLAHEEWIAPGDLMQETGVAATLACQHLDRREGERRKAHSNHVMPGQLAKRQPQGMICRKFVMAISGDQDRARSLNPAADESQKVQRGRVGPMHVFQHNHGSAFRPCQILQ